MSVALAMAYQNLPLDREVRRRVMEDLLGRWRGNRGEEWQPTPADIDQLMESATLWLAERVRVNWLTAEELPREFPRLPEGAGESEAGAGPEGAAEGAGEGASAAGVPEPLADAGRPTRPLRLLPADTPRAEPREQLGSYPPGSRFLGYVPESWMPPGWGPARWMGPGWAPREVDEWPRDDGMM